MSVDTDSAVIDLPEMDRSFRARAKRLWKFLRVTGPFILGLGLLGIVDKVALASNASEILWFSVPNLESQPIVRLLCSTNPLILKTALFELDWKIFIPIALGRMLVGDILWYYIGKRSALVVKEIGSGRLQRLAEWLRHSHHYIILLAVFLLTFGEAWLPPFIGYLLVACNIYAIAGAAEVKLKMVVAFDLVATIAFLFVFYEYGTHIYR